jgi:hypothetical protein
MNLSEYISVTRTVSDKAPSDFIYKRFYQRVLNAFDRPNLLPELKVVYTLQRSTEVMVLSGKEYLLYDQYLGQTMNMLNRILLNSESPMDAQMYSFKLLAERYALRGRFDWAMMFAYSYQVLRAEHRSYRQDKDFIRRSTFTFSQELFIIAHEIAHLIIKNPSRFISLPQKDSSAAGEGGYENYGVVIRSLAEQFKLGRIDHDVFTPSSANAFTRMLFDELDLTARSDVREECCCDVLATIMLISVLKQDKGIDFSDVLIAVAMCLRHLRILGVVEHMSSIGWLADQPSNQPLFHDLILRTSNIREFARTLAGAHIEGVNLQYGFEMVQMAEHYEEIIDDPIMFSVSEKVMELMSVPELKELYRDTSKSTLREIGEMTGFFQTAG